MLHELGERGIIRLSVLVVFVFVWLFVCLFLLCHLPSLPDSIMKADLTLCEICIIQLNRWVRGSVFSPEVADWGSSFASSHDSLDTLWQATFLIYQECHQQDY